MRPADARAAAASAADGALRVERVTAEVLAAAGAKLEALRGTEVAQSVVQRPDARGEAGFASWDRQLVDPALVEIALELGIPLRIPACEPETYTFWLHAWKLRGAPEDSLARVIAHPWFGRVLINSFFPTRETKGVAGNWLEHATRYASFAPVFAALGPRIAARVDAWTIGALEVHADWLESLCRPALFRSIPELVEVVRRLDAARLLAAQLRGGLMDEWGWPAQDQALERLGAKPEFDHSGPPPYRVFYSRETKRIVACGPDGVVFDRAYEPPYKDIRSFWYLGGDVLACSYPTAAQWIDKQIELEAPPYGFYQIATGDDSAITKSGMRVKPGATAIARDTARGTERMWFDGTRFFGITSETRVGTDLTPSDERQSLFTLDPETGARGPAALPAWFASILGERDALVVTSEAPHLQVVPATGASSPLGAKDGLGGAALVQRENAFECVGIDGRRGPGLVNGLPVGALITFPERDGFYPIVMSGHDSGIAMPDGITPLVPLELQYWQVPAPRPTLAHWYALRPRDPAGSRALARCTDDVARSLVNGGAVPEVTHPRLVEAIAAMATRAREASDTIARIQGHLGSLGTVESTYVNDDAKSLATLLDHGMHWWVEADGIELGQQMLDVSRYLFGDASTSATPARTAFPWDALFSRIGEVLYRALASGTPKEHRGQLVGVLRMWAETAFPDHLDRTRVAVMSLASDSEALRGTDRHHRDRLVAHENRYFVRSRGALGTEKPTVDALVIEATRDGVFRLPPGGAIVEEVAIDRRFDRAAIDSALRLATERERVELDPAFIELVAKETGLSPTAATLVWSAGYEPWLVGEKARERLRIDRSKLDAAEREIKGAKFAELYRRAMPADPAQMFTLEGAAQLAAAWNALPRT